MPRPEQQLYPATPIAPLRPAATVLLLRDGSDGLEVLMTQRTQAASFAASMHVFPGGAFDEADRVAAANSALVLSHPEQSPNMVAQALAAIRESFEEVGVLLALRADGTPVTQADVNALDATIGRRSPSQAFYDACAERGWQLLARDCHALSRWTAPLDLPKRFDTHFMLAPMPEGQTVHTDGEEQVNACWVLPAVALQHWKEKAWTMLPPTFRSLQTLTQWPNTATALQACPHGASFPHMAPRGAQREGREVRLMPNDLAYGEISLVAPHGQIDHAIDWQHDHPVPLLRNVQRLTAANAGTMTGPGTNSYLIGTPSSGYIVVDPGPHDSAHIARIFQATGGAIRHIVCTHSHPDHSPGAQPLQAMCTPQPPIWGLPHGPHARSDSHFTPNHVLEDGATLVLQEPDGSTHTLRALHTPGHTANHLCLVLEEDGLLLSGDHILNGSTTIVSLPDGDMGDYLRSLDKLSAACVVGAISHILPAHGYVIERAEHAIAHLKNHRLAREAKVLAAMQQLPDGTPEDWVALAYADTPSALWSLARHSLLAHVQHLREQQTV